MIGRAAPLLLAAMAAASYGAVASAISANRSLWFDEVLAVWAARLPNAQDVATAIWNGAEFSPPTYDILLHMVFRLDGSDPLAARLPSIVAVALTAALIGYIAGKRLGEPFGALAFALTLNSALFDYAIQARAYALLTTLLAAALVLWIDAGERVRPARAAGIGLCLFASVSLHYYATVSFAVFALLELLWSLRRRRLRPAIWIALAAGAAACAVWLPLLRRHAALNAGDVDSPQFYAAPTMAKLTEHVQALFVGPAENWLFVLAAILAIAAAAVCARIFAPAPEETAVPGETDLVIAGAGLLAALPIAFVLALTITHAFSARYALASSLGLVLLVTVAIRRAPYRNTVAYALLLLLCATPLLRGLPSDYARAAQQMLTRGPASGPIVVGDADLFVELLEAADPAVRARLVHLKRPAGVFDGNSASENQLLRLKASYRPDLPVLEFDVFTQERPAFVMLARPGWRNDALADHLVAKGWVAGAFEMGQRLSLLQMRAPQ